MLISGPYMLWVSVCVNFIRGLTSTPNDKFVKHFHGNFIYSVTLFFTFISTQPQHTQTHTHTVTASFIAIEMFVIFFFFLFVVSLFLLNHLWFLNSIKVKWIETNWNKRTNTTVKRIHIHTHTRTYTQFNWKCNRKVLELEFEFELKDPICNMKCTKKPTKKTTYRPQLLIFTQRKSNQNKISNLIRSYGMFKRWWLKFVYVDVC